MINISIDGIPFEFPPKISIIEACKLAGVSIPRFCYHESLSVAGNCRMCVIEIDTVEKPVASCATEAKSGMEIFTNNPFVKKARENVVETLLINHPLDCPICDQAGECDLQDQTKIYGSSHSRFFVMKKSSEDKDCNPLIKTIMTRCITCTRCVRYSSEVAGKDFFGTLNRGKYTEIGSYTSQLFDSEMSGNVVDLCPVGALTSGPYSFSGRPWELRVGESIDISDSLGSNLYVNYKENSIFRVLPKSNKERNDTFISDIARYSFEHTKTNRLTLNFVQNLPFEQILNNNYDKAINIIIDENCDTKTANLLQNLKYTSNKKVNIYQNQKANISSSNFIINEQNNIDSLIRNLTNFCFLIGTNPRLENSILNYKIRFKYRVNNISILNSGFSFNNNTPQKNIFSSVKNILKFFEGKVQNIKLYNNLSNNLFIFGEAFTNRIKEYYVFKSIISKLNLKYIELLKYSNSEALKLYSFSKTNRTNALNSTDIFVNLDDNISLRRLHSKSNKSVWINTNGSTLSNKSSIVIPTKTHFESEGTLISLGYLPQKHYKVINYNENIKNNHNILQDIFSTQNLDLEDKIVIEEKRDSNNRYKQLFNNLNSENLTFSKINKYPMKDLIRNFCNSNKFSKNSKTLQKYSSQLSTNYLNLI